MGSSHRGHRGHRETLWLLEMIRKKGLGLLRQGNDNTGKQGPNNENEVLSNRGHRGMEDNLWIEYMI